MKLVVATNNPNKIRELSDLSRDERWLELCMAPEGFAPEETGRTFVENARIKAQAAARATGMPAVADDSGLIVEALNGRPGIHSARYCQGSDSDRNKKVLQELENVPPEKRQAAFMCAMVVCHPDESMAFSTIRAWEGKIGFAEKGCNGFGYDAIFHPAGHTRTSAELSPEEKNEFSHRAQAWRQVVNFLKTNVDFSVKTKGR